MHTPIPPALEQALQRADQSQNGVLTRAVFAQALNTLALANPSPADAAKVAQVFSWTPGPDWGGKDQREFLTSYGWHLLFAQQPAALALVGGIATYYHPATTSMPSIWRPHLKRLTPAHFDWMVAWAQTFGRSSLPATLLDMHLGDRAWDGVWTAWVERDRQISIPVPHGLIRHPALSNDPEGTLSLLERLVPNLDTNLSDDDPDDLDSHLLLALLGHRGRFEPVPFAPHPAHHFPLGDKPGIDLLRDAHSREGQAALLAAFPTARAFLDASPEARAAHLRARIIAAVTPPVPTVRVPVRTKAVKTLLDTQATTCDDLPLIQAYDQRCREALASGLLDASATATVQQALAALRASARTATVSLGTKTGAATPLPGLKNTRDTPLSAAFLEQCHEAIDLLGAKGYPTLAQQGEALMAQHFRHHYYRRAEDTLVQALIASPSHEGVIWMAQQNWSHPHLPALLNAAQMPSWWADAVMDAFAARSTTWCNTASYGATEGVVTGGRIWEIHDPAQRTAFFARETAKPRDQWDLAVPTMPKAATSWANNSGKRRSLVGLLRLSLALRDGEHDWLDAFTQAAEKTHPTDKTLLGRWARASGHTRIQAHAALRDPIALLALDPAAIQARLDAIFGP